MPSSVSLSRSTNNQSHNCNIQSASPTLSGQHEDKDKEELNYLITHDKDHFQEYLCEKGFDHQSKGEHVKTGLYDLQLCLSLYTDLDVLDEDNKFICMACNAQNRKS